MADHQIRISSDVGSAMSGFNKLKSAFDNLTKDTSKVGGKGASQEFQKTNQEAQKLSKELKFQQDVLKNQADLVKKLNAEINSGKRLTASNKGGIGSQISDADIQARKTQLESAVKDYNQERKRLNDLSKIVKDQNKNSNNGVAGGDSGAGFLNSSFGKVATIATAGLLATGVAIRVMSSLIAPAIEAATGRIRLRGLGLSQKRLDEVEAYGSQFGFSKNESRAHAEELLRATGSTDRLNSFQLLSRISGQDPSQLFGAAGSFRQSGSSNKESFKLIKDTLAGAVAAGFDQSRSIEILQSIADKTETLAQTRNVDPKVISDLVMRTMSGSSYFQQNSGRAMGAIGGLDSLFTGGGTGTGLAVQSLAQLYKGQGRSTTDLLYESRQGLFNSKDAPERIEQYLSNFLDQSTNSKIKAGGGLDQLSGDQLKQVTMAFTNLVKKSGGNISDDTSMALFKGFLTKTEGDRQKFLQEQAKVVQEQQKTSIDYLQSSDNKLLQMNSLLQDIKLEIADGLVAGLNKILDFLGLGSNRGIFGQVFGTVSADVGEAMKKAQMGQGSGVPSYMGGNDPASRAINDMDKGTQPTNYGGARTMGGLGGGSSTPPVSPFRSILNRANPLATAPKLTGTNKDWGMVDPRLYDIAQKANADLSFKPNFTSAYRSQAQQNALNVKGKASVSNHTYGHAVDVGIAGLSKQQIREALDFFNSQPYTKAEIHGGNHIHVDYLPPDYETPSQKRKKEERMAKNGGAGKLQTAAQMKKRQAQNLTQEDHDHAHEMGTTVPMKPDKDGSITDTLKNLSQTLRMMQEKQKKKPVINSQISQINQYALNHSETVV